jgi:hypothetical protein
MAAPRSWSAHALPNAMTTSRGSIAVRYLA